MPLGRLFYLRKGSISLPIYLLARSASGGGQIGGREFDRDEVGLHCLRVPCPPRSRICAPFWLIRPTARAVATGLAAASSEADAMALPLFSYVNSYFTYVSWAEPWPARPPLVDASSAVADGSCGLAEGWRAAHAATMR